MVTTSLGALPSASTFPGEHEQRQSQARRNPRPDHRRNRPETSRQRCPCRRRRAGWKGTGRGAPGTKLRPCRGQDVEQLGRHPRCYKPELGAGQAHGSRCLESHHPVEQTVRMKQPATASIQRPSLALLGAEPFRAAMEFAWHKLGKSDDAKPGGCSSPDASATSSPPEALTMTRACSQAPHHPNNDVPETIEVARCP